MSKIKCVNGLLIKCWLLLSATLVGPWCYGQTNQNPEGGHVSTQVRPLVVGQTVPKDIEIHHVLNYTANTIRVNDLKGKLAIIDFWGSWCSSCIRQFPLLDSIQRKFKDKLIVLAVTAEDKEKIIPFLAKRKITNNVSFPIVTNDTLLGKLFPHYYTSQAVIISPEGRVNAITGSEYITLNNITRILKGISIPLPVRHDIDKSRPLFTDSYLPEDKLTHYSIFLRGKIEGLLSGTIDKKSPTTMRWTITNFPILKIYQSIASYLIPGLNPKRMIIKIKDPDNLIYSKDSLNNVNWETQNLYTYDMIIPIGDSNNLYRYMLEDLSRYSPYRVKVEKVKVPCWVLVTKKEVNQTGEKNKHAADGIPVSYLADWINNYDSLIKEPVVNESGYIGNIDIELPHAPVTIESLNKMIAVYGLSLIKKNKLIDMLVITDND